MRLPSPTRAAAARAAARTVAIITALTFAASIATALTPASALAWHKTAAPVWGHRVVTYYVAAPAYRDEMRTVASIINHSGVRTHLKAVTSPKRANILIKKPGGLPGCNGLARSSWYGSHRAQSNITWAPCPAFSTNPVFVAEARLGTIRVLTHEVLHTYSLDHQNKRCALMNYAVTNAPDGTIHPLWCKTADRPAAGYHYCRTLEPDDLKGLIALYGGKARPLPPILCKRTGLPAPTTITAVGSNVGSASPQIDIDWSGVSTDATGVQIRVTSTRCERAVEMPAAQSSSTIDANPAGPTGSTTYPVVGPGSYCVSVSEYAEAGSLRIYGPIATRMVTVPA